MRCCLHLQTAVLTAPLVLQPASPLAARLKEEASKCFGRKDYSKALEAYEAALKATGEESTPEDRALLHSNKAACYLMQQKCALRCGFLAWCT